MKLREDQKRFFEGQSRQAFEDRMVDHLGRFFPVHTLRLGDENTRELIRYGIERAERYGFVSERDVCKFIDLMIALGVEFDEDRERPWVQETLESTRHESPSEKIDELFERSIRRLEAKARLDSARERRR